MKKWSRLTAFMLAVAIMLSNVSGALALVEVNFDTLMQWIQNVKEANGLGDVVKLIRGGEVYPVESFVPGEDKPYTVEETYILENSYPVEQEAPVADVPMDAQGKVTLVAPEAGKWQVQAGTQWVTVSGETDAAFEVTYAKVESLFVANNGMAKVRWLSADGASTSDVVNIALSYSAMNIPEEDVSMAYAAKNGTMLLADEPTEGSDPEFKTVAVSVYFRFENGQDAAKEYQYTIEHGGDLIQEIELPSVVGYIPAHVDHSYANDYSYTFTPPDKENGTTGKLVLNMHNITHESSAYTVVYVPDYVDFTVEHYQMGFDATTQNAQLVKTEIIDSNGSNAKKTGEAVGDQLATAFDGFKALWYDSSITVAADGSTVVKIFYERLWYLMLFDLDGGYGVDPIYDQFGAAINVGMPTRTGYSFLGWSLEDPETVETPTLVELPVTMPALENGRRTYYAVWKADELVKVSVAIWGENADDEEYSYIKSSEFYAKPGATVTYQPGNIVCGYTEHTHTAACYDCGYTEHVHGADCCSVTEHTHSADCCSLLEHTHGPNCCTVPQHTHSSACCTLPTHSHGTDCYANVGNAFSSGLGQRIDGNETNGYIGERENWALGWYGTGEKYIYINGTWYRYNGNASIGSTVTPICGEEEVTHDDHDCVYCNQVEHTHGDGKCEYCERYEHTHGVDCDYCDDAEHTHGDGNCVYCSAEEHTHTAECLWCTLAEHKHSSSCYLTDPGMNKNLWTYVKSDEVTVDANGSTVMNVYYDRTTFTLTFHYDYRSSWGSGYYQSSSTITDKWGADIGERFLAVNDKAKGNLWSTSTGGGSPWTSYLQIMPEYNEDYYCTRTSNNEQVASYFTQTLDGGYELEYQVKAYSDGNLTISKEDFYEMEGFTYDHGTDGGGRNMPSPASYGNFDGAQFFYNRNTYNLVYNDGFNDVKTEKVKFEAPLTGYDEYVPSIPAAFEEGSMQFVGWYLNPEGTGEPYDFDAHTMPAENLIVYAKWELVKHDVTVYLKYEDIAEGKDPIVDTFQVTHYDTVPFGKIPTADEMKGKNGAYTFAGWFYIDKNGTEKAYDPETMTVTRDMDIYAKWSATQPIPFTINYYLADKDGNLLDENGNIITSDEQQPVKVADTTISQALDGMSITFEAKTNTALYEDYRVGYFPTTSSHTVKISVSGENTYDFKYVKTDMVPYKVVYLLEQEDGSYVKHSEKLVENNPYTIVTENYLPIRKYIPDAYQKRLIVTYGGTTEDGGNLNKADAGENIIFFYYHLDTENALWTVTHYIEPIGGITAENGWQQYGPTESKPGKIKTEVTAVAKNLEGFTLSIGESTVDLWTIGENNQDVCTTEGVDETLTETLPIGGLDFHLRYTRNKYPIVVRHVNEYGEELCEKELFADANSNKLFYYQDIIKVSTDKTFPGYTLSTPPVDYQIKHDGTTLETVEKNIVTFVYTENEATINYVVVGPEDATGAVGNLTLESETVKVMTGTATGSTATPASRIYEFVGWYTDEDCTIPVAVPTDGALSGDLSNTFVPAKEAEVKEGDTVVTPAMYESATFYAKFIYAPTTLKIVKDVTGDETVTDTFVFRVSKGAANVAEVTITGEGSALLYGLEVNGEYSVEEIGASFRYDPKPAGQTITLKPDENLDGSENTVTITNTYGNDKWLDGTDHVENIFKNPKGGE